jgi:hypothetical protein
MAWAPDYNLHAATLRVHVFIEGYPAAILAESLPPALRELASGPGEVLEVEVAPGHDQAYPQGGGNFEPGEIVITADHLTERFDPVELRRRVDALVDEAVLEGDAMKERDDARADKFLEGLAAEPDE